MMSSKNFGKTRLIILLAGVLLMSLALVLASSQTARAGDSMPNDAMFLQGPAPALVKSQWPLVAKNTGLKVNLSPSQVDGEGGPAPMDLPFGPNVRVTNDAAEDTHPSIVKDSVSGLTLIAYQHYTGTDWEIYIASSTDDGTTWTANQFTNAPSNEMNPSLAVTSTGAFALSFETDVDTLTMPIFQSLDGSTWFDMSLAFLPTSPFSLPSSPNVVTQQPPIGSYPSGVMFAWQTFCSDATNCGGGSYTAYWYGSSDWTAATPTVDLGNSYWLTDPVRVDRFGLVDTWHPSAGWSSTGYFMAVDDEGYTAAERRATWLVLDEPAQTASNEWIQNWWSQDALGCFPVMGASGTNTVIISTIKNNTATGHPTDHRAIFFSSSDGWSNVLNADWIDATASDQRAFSMSGYEMGGTTTFRATYYSDTTVSAMDTIDVGATWNGPMTVNDNAGTGVNDHRSTSIWTDSSGAPKVAWQDNRDGNVEIYTTGYLTYAVTISSTCGGVPSTMQILIDGSAYPHTPYTTRWTAGTSHTLQITNPTQNEGFCKQCKFVRWSDGSTNTQKTFTNVNADIDITAIFDDYYRVQLDTTPVPLQLTWKGTTGGTPLVTFERPQTYTAVTPSPQPGGIPSERYVFVDWSDGDTSATKSVTVGTACLNLTANFGLEYQITIQAVPAGNGIQVGYDTTPLAGEPVTFWSAAGIQHMLLTKSPQPDTPTDTRFRFERWAGGPTTWGWNVTPMGANTYTANFVIQYKITIRANIENPGPTVSSDIPNNIPDCTLQQPAPLICWADLNSPANLIIITPQATAGSQYVFTGWSDGNLQQMRAIGPINAPATYMSMWTAMYSLTMNMDSSCEGTLSATPPPVNGFHPKGENVNIDFTVQTMPAGERYTWLQWVGSGVGSYSGATKSAAIVMNDAITETAFCKHEFEITLNTSPIPLGYVIGGPGGDVGVTGLRANWWEVGTNHWFNVTAVTQPGGTGTRYAFDKWSDQAVGNPIHTMLTVITSQSFTAQFKTQYLVTLTQVPATPAGLGGLACSNPDCWFDDGSSATVSVTVNTYPPSAQFYEYRLTSWTGDASGSATSYTFLSISQPRSATANWALWFKVTVTSPQGSPVCTNTDCWYLSGSSATVTVTSPYPTAATGTRYVITSWTGDATGTSNSVTIAMGASRNVTAVWKTQYQLTLTSKCGGTDCGAPTQSEPLGWYDSGLTATLTVSSPATVGDKKYNFNGWGGDATGTDTTATVTMNAPKVVTANWAEEPKQAAGGDLLVWIIIIVIIIVVVVLVAILLMKRKKSPVEEELPPEEIPPAPPAKTAPPPAKPVSQAPRPAAPPPAGGPAPRPQAPPPAKK